MDGIPSKAEYALQISRWNWPLILETAAGNYDGETDEDGSATGLCFLGTVFHLMPSGKYYMPFACSNVDACKRCNGSGVVSRKKADPARYNHLDLMVNCTVKAALHFGSFPDWPPALKEEVAFLRKIRDRYSLDMPCPSCKGVGSEEAHRDELFQEALQEEAEKHDMFITSGEGDPCDILAGICLDGKITSSENSMGHYTVTEITTGRTRYFQTDYDFPGLATTFGWGGAEGEDDIQEAIEFLDAHEGAIDEDPGYFGDEEGDQ